MQDSLIHDSDANNLIRPNGINSRAFDSNLRLYGCLIIKNDCRVFELIGMVLVNPLLPEKVPVMLVTHVDNGAATLVEVSTE